MIRTCMRCCTWWISLWWCSLGVGCTWSHHIPLPHTRAATNATYHSLPELLLMVANVRKSGGTINSEESRWYFSESLNGPWSDLWYFVEFPAMKFSNQMTDQCVMVRDSIQTWEVKLLKAKESLVSAKTVKEVTRNITRHCTENIGVILSRPKYVNLINVLTSNERMKINVTPLQSSSFIRYYIKVRRFIASTSGPI